MGNYRFVPKRESFLPRKFTAIRITRIVDYQHGTHSCIPHKPLSAKDAKWRAMARVDAQFTKAVSIKLVSL